MMEHFVASLPDDLLKLQGGAAPFYLLLDGAARGVADKLYSLDPAPELNPLFFGTCYAKAINSGPILLRVELESELLRWFLSDDVYTYAGIIFSSELPLDELLKILKLHLSVIMPNGKHGLLRYYDPQIFAELFFSGLPSPVSSLTPAFYFFAANAYDINNMNTWYIGASATALKAFSGRDEPMLAPTFLEYLQKRKERRIINEHLQTLMRLSGKNPVTVKPQEITEEVSHFDVRMLRSAKALYISNEEYDKAYARLDELEERFNILTMEHLFEVDSMFEVAPEHSGQYTEILSNTSIPMRARLDKCAELGQGGKYGS